MNGLCNVGHPFIPGYRCNREANHPGEHCHSRFGSENHTGTGYQNIWWFIEAVRDPASRMQSLTSAAIRTGVPLDQSDLRRQADVEVLQ